MEQPVCISLGSFLFLEFYNKVKKNYIYIYVSFCLFSEYSETSLQNAIGCKNLDVPFEDWPLRNMGSPIYATAAMECSKQTYHNLSDIVDKFASDQQYWSIRFMEAWDIMATNGYTDLKEGPKSGWFGHYSMMKQDRSLVAELEAQMNNEGLVWTDPKVEFLATIIDLFDFPSA